MEYRECNEGKMVDASLLMHPANVTPGILFDFQNPNLNRHYKIVFTPKVSMN